MNRNEVILHTVVEEEIGLCASGDIDFDTCLKAMEQASKSFAEFIRNKPGSEYLTINELYWSYISESNHKFASKLKPKKL